MAFDFDKAIKDAASKTSSSMLAALVLGPSGGGKSSLLGTMGVKTLYLFTMGESHGPKAAKKLGGPNVVPVAIDRDGDKVLNAEQSYERLLSVLSDIDGIKKAGFKGVAIDGATEIEAIIRSTAKWANTCKSAQGKHNSFAEGPATIAMFRPIFMALKTLQEQAGVHFAMSCILDVKELGPEGDIVEAQPRLAGYSVAESVIQQFDDVLPVSRMSREGVVKHKIQMMSDLTRVSKDAIGQVKKAINFSPRITGVDAPGALLDADLSKIIELKEGASC